MKKQRRIAIPHLPGFAESVEQSIAPGSLVARADQIGEVVSISGRGLATVRWSSAALPNVTVHDVADLVLIREDGEQ